MTASVGDSIVLGSEKWSFSSPQVANAFDLHIENSIPLYHHGHDLILGLSDFFLTSGSTCYDLGCATARLTAKLAARHSTLGVLIKGLDVEPGMIAQATNRCQALPNVELLTADIADVSLTETDLVISYYTMQFIKPGLRRSIVQKIYNALNLGSAFIMFEKVVVEDAYLQEMATLLHANFKLANGYNPSEVTAKANSLRGILKPMTTSENQRLLAAAGFSRVSPIMKHLCFEGYLAVK